MKKIIVIVAALSLTACEQLAVKGKTQTIDSDYLSYLCIDNVKYIKSLGDNRYSLAPKFQSDGKLETCNIQVQ